MEIDSNLNGHIPTYHFAYTRESSTDTALSRLQRPTVLHTIRLRNDHSVGNNHAGTVPARRHGPTECIKKILRFLRHTLSTPLLAFLQARDGSGFPTLQGANIQGVDGRIGIREGRCGIRSGGRIMWRK